MPSTLIGNPLASGAQPLWTGNPWSGRNAAFPAGGIQLKWDLNASGRAYVAFSGGQTIPASGGMTITSGGMFLSGGGLLDGMPLDPGNTYFVPKLLLQNRSGVCNIFVMCDPAASGQGRMSWEGM